MLCNEEETDRKSVLFCLTHTNKDLKDSRVLAQLFLYLRMKVYLSNYRSVILPVDFYLDNQDILTAKLFKAKFTFSTESIKEHLLDKEVTP